MSKIAKQPVELPAGVDVVTSGRTVTFTGSKGKLSLRVHERVNFENRSRSLYFSPVGEKDKALAGSMRAIANNMAQGVSRGFERKLKLVGVGFRAQMKAKTLEMALGFSHPVRYETPPDLTIETLSQTLVLVKGADKQKVCQAAAEIRAFRPPEPYKGKGVCYDDEVVARKEGKRR